MKSIFISMNCLLFYPTIYGDVDMVIGIIQPVRIVLWLLHHPFFEYKFNFCLLG